MSMYGGVYKGIFTMSRYTHAQLMVPGEIENILSHGMSIYLMTNPERVVRAPNEIELGCEVRSIDDLLALLYEWYSHEIVYLNDSALLEYEGLLPILPTIYKGVYDATNNTPELTDSTGSDTWQWLITNMPERTAINLGGEDISVKTGDYIIHKYGTYVLSESECLSDEERLYLHNSIIDYPIPEIDSPDSVVYIADKKEAYLQLILEGYNQPTYEIDSIVSLLEVELTPTADEIWIKTEKNDTGIYEIDVYASSKLGPRRKFNIIVNVY